MRFSVTIDQVSPGVSDDNLSQDKLSCRYWCVDPLYSPYRSVSPLAAPRLRRLVAYAFSSLGATAVPPASRTAVAFQKGFRSVQWLRHQKAATSTSTARNCSATRRRISLLE